MLGFNSFRLAQARLAGIERIKMIKKGQARNKLWDCLSPAAQLYALAAYSQSGSQGIRLDSR